MQYVMRVGVSSIDAVLSHLLHVCLAGSQLIGYLLCVRDVWEMCCLISSLVQVMCTRNLVNTELFLCRWYAEKKGSGQYTHKRIERKCAWFGSWCSARACTYECVHALLASSIHHCTRHLHNPRVILHNWLCASKTTR